jgi:hypothetical protein
MSGNNCDDAFQRIQELREENRKLQEMADAMERQMKAAGVYSYAPKGDSVILPGRSGKPVELDRADIERGYKQLAGTMSSQEVEDMVARGFDVGAKPNGADGRFQNYDRLLREVDISTVDDYARLAEALGITHERIAPDDFAFLTQTYDKERLTELVSNYYRDLGVSDADLLVKAAVKTAPVINAVENKVWLRFWADRSKRVYLDTLEQIRTYMQAIPGSPVPAELKQDAFKQYKLALVMERHNNLASRRHAQALRSQQEQILGLEQFRLDLGDEQEVAEAIGLRGKDLDKDEHFGRVLQAIDDNGVKGEEQLRLLIDTTEIDGLDPKSKLDKDWFNTHMRMANALLKDSQLGNLNTQIKMNAGSNAVMAFFGPVQQTMANGVKLTPAGTQLTRAPLLEASKISGEAFNYAWTTMKTTWRRDLDRVFKEGVSHYSGNLDTYGKSLLTNNQDLLDMQAIVDQPYKQGANWAATLAHPHNLALFTNKLQAAARILAFTKPYGAKGATRVEAALSALGVDMGQGSRGLRIKDIDTYVPWKPFLRTMAGVDEMFGKYQYLFKLKADLEVKARMEGAQLGLLSEQDRTAWVQARIDEAIYQATPTEANIKAFRKQNNLKGSDFTDDEIAALIAENNLAGAPSLGTPESAEALNYSAGMRFQDAPTGGTAAAVDRATMSLRQNWAVDRYLMPYWRSPFMGMLFDHRLTTFGAIDTIKMLGAKDPSPELVARVKAGWVMSGALLGAFGMLDAAGLVRGGNETDPAKRNTIAGMPLGGLPVLNTLFLWKDIQTTAEASLANEYDANELGLAWMKVMTNQVMRQTGIQQVQLLMDAMLDGSQAAWEKVRQAIGFMGSGQVPFSGAIRNVERLVGSDRASFFRDAPDTAAQNYLLEKDNPFAQMEQSLRNWAYDTQPLIAGLTGAKRKETDHLGSPIGHIKGINFSKGMPGFPSIWPSGKINDVVYGELDTQDMLDPPGPLLTRKLEGVAMSDDLQAEYNDIHGSLKGDPNLPPTARLGLAGKKVQAFFPFPVETVTDMGIRIKKNGGASLPLLQILDKVTAGKTKKEAFYTLFTSPWYQAVEDDPTTSANPAGGLPPALRRTKTAQVLIKGITDYYDLLTQDELERRAAAGTSDAAKQWSEAKNELATQTFKQSQTQLMRLGERLRDALSPAE